MSMANKKRKQGKEQPQETRKTKQKTHSNDTKKLHEVDEELQEKRAKENLLRQEIDTRTSAAMHQVEQRKAEMIEQGKKSHDKSMIEIQAIRKKIEKAKGSDKIKLIEELRKRASSVM